MAVGHREAIFCIDIYCLYMIARPRTSTIYRYFAWLHKHTACIYISHLLFLKLSTGHERDGLRSIYIVNQDTSMAHSAFHHGSC